MNDLTSLIKDWWAFGAFLFTAGFSYVAGRERQRYRVDEVGQKVEGISKEMESQGKRIASLEKQGTAEAVQLAEISTSQRHILTALADIKATLKEKADKP